MNKDKRINLMFEFIKDSLVILFLFVIIPLGVLEIAGYDVTVEIEKKEVTK